MAGNRLQASGPISMDDINAIFNRGKSLGNYRGVLYYTPSKEELFNEAIYKTPV